MKLFTKGFAFSLLLFSITELHSQPGSSNTIPELVFKNPQLIEGTAGQDGAVYRFSNVTSGIDATVKIARRSSSEVVLTNIDVESSGWVKAFQPQLGIPGSVAPGKNWWMEFEMRFLKAGTDKKEKIKSFNVTALDVDGDGWYVQEYIQMNKVKTASCSPVTYLVDDNNSLLTNTLSLLSGISGYNLTGSDKKFQGPKTNFTNIDTASTAVMTTYGYEEKDMISFVVGAKSSGGYSTAGERLNSLWFKAFSLQPQQTLPVKLNNFAAVVDNRNVSLSWSADAEIDFSHYVVQRSTDGRNYSDIALVFAAGASVSYRYKDPNVSSSGSLVYYRLRLVEKTNEFSYSDVRVIKLGEKSPQLTTYPNPVVDQLRVTLPADWQGRELNLEIFGGATGSRLQNARIPSASQTETLRLNQLAKGFYLVKASCNGQVLEQRIIKD